jgi:two-component system, LuxR family, response regulator FixJ
MTRGTVFLVDDDASVRKALQRLIRAAGYDVESFADAAGYLASPVPSLPACIVLDIRMPTMSGFELQSAIAGTSRALPVVFITGHGDVPMAVNAMKSGAADFIQKPFRDQDLLDRIHKALAQDSETRKWRAQEKVIRERLASLTPREAEVMQRVVKGQANKVIAMDLGVSQRTVELHRARVMHKMKMRSLADLVSAIQKINEIDSARPGGPSSTTLAPST